MYKFKALLWPIRSVKIDASDALLCFHVRYSSRYDIVTCSSQCLFVLVSDCIAHYGALRQRPAQPSSYLRHHEAVENVFLGVPY